MADRPGYRASFLKRFQARLDDPAFRDAMATSGKAPPEWSAATPPPQGGNAAAGPAAKAEPSGNSAGRGKNDPDGRTPLEADLEIQSRHTGRSRRSRSSWRLSSRTGAARQRARRSSAERAADDGVGECVARNYTNTQVKPLLETQLKYKFLPQSVPAFAATEQFNELRKKYPDYAYKEATLNPTNPRNRATDWEVDVVNVFRSTSATSRGHRRARHAGRPIALPRPADPDQGSRVP